MVTAYSLSTVTQNSLPNTPASADVNVVTHYTYDAAGNMTDGATRLLDMTDRLLKDLAHRDDDHRAAPKAEVVARAIAALRAEITAQQTSGAIAHDHVATSLLGRLFLADAANQRTIRIVEAQTYIYDANGNRVNRVRLGHGESDIQGVDYAYDAENRLVTAQDYYGNARGDRANGGITSMAYDGEGRRLVKTYEAHQDDDGDERSDDGRTRIQTGGDNGHEESDQTRVEYVFDELLPIAEYPISHERPDTRSDKSRDDSHTTPVEIAHTNYYRGDQGRILEQASFGGEDKGQTSWYHYDGLGSVSTLTQRSGERSTTYNYASYGQPKSQGSDSGKAGTHYTFTGQSWDSTTGLYEFYARPYDPATGTWLTQDPYRGQVSQPATLHRYGYVGGSPVNYVDAYGYATPQQLDLNKKTAGQSATLQAPDPKIGCGINMSCEPKETINDGGICVASNSTPPTAQQLLYQADVLDAFQKAWNDSLENKREEGGWIIWNRNSGEIRIQRLTKNLHKGGISIVEPPRYKANEQVIGFFHTHPDLPLLGGFQFIPQGGGYYVKTPFPWSPSPADRSEAQKMNLPSFVVTYPYPMTTFFAPSTTVIPYGPDVGTYSGRF